MNIKFSDLIILNKPDKIYIPIDDNKDYTIIPKNGEYIYKASPIAHTKGELKETIYSPLSGKYLEINKDDNYKYLVIENDYKEMNEELRGINKQIYNIPYEDFLKKLEEISVNGIYTKYLNSNKKTIIIDCFNNSYNYIKYILENYLEEILEMVDAIYEINKLNNCIFVINKKDKKLKKLLEQRIGTYLHMKICKVSYRKKENRINLILKKNKLNEENIIIENINNILIMKNIFKYNIPFIEKYLIIKDGKKFNPIKVKIGTKISYIFNSLGINKTKYAIVTNEKNIEIDNQDIVIDGNINEIII